MNILIVGLGSIAKKHILALKKHLKAFNLYALRSVTGASDITGVVNIYDLNEIRHIDFAIISNPTNLHAEIILKLIKKGITLFIEKPPVHDLIIASKLNQQIIQENILTYVACNLRFHSAIQFLKEYLSNNARPINEVNIYCGSYLPKWREGIDFRNTYSANREMGGGVHLDLYHELDYAYWLFGKPQKTTVLKTHNSTLNINAIDYASYNLYYENFVCNIKLNYYRPFAKREIEILFEDEIIVADILKNEITSTKGSSLFQDTNFSISDTYSAQMKYFLENTMKNKNSMNTFVESMEVLEICLADEG